jgi:hypothetical protein
MALHHVAQGTGGVVEVPAAADSDGLADSDLHLLDRGGIPQRLEDRVGEAQGEQVLDRFLAEVVVDAEDVPLVDGLGDGFVGAMGRCGVGADRLLDDDAGVAVGQSRLGERTADGAEEVRAVER